jgi:Fe-S-cluster containining protein
VLNFAPFRKYPTKLAAQDFDDDREVCHHCVSGACCSSEDPIYLTSFDILRLSAFFNMSPAEFLLKFTQDRFDGEDSDSVRRPWLDDPDSSKVTYLRRRANVPTSPCIFLKYIREPDGTPRRICSVHDGRPLSCREYYFHDCQRRLASELATLLAEGFEKVRDGEITAELVDAELARFGAHDFATAPASASMTYNFWLEMRRVVHMEQANVEGAQSYDMAAYQDPIDEKLNRVLSAKYLRFEEDYGPVPRDEQLMPYTSGLSFAGSPEYQRIMAVQAARPTSDLFTAGNYPFYFGLRTMMPGVKHADAFPTIPDAEADAFLASIPPTPLFPQHEQPDVQRITLRDLYASVLKGCNHLIRFASFLATMGSVVEEEPPGRVELELLTLIAGFEPSLNPYIARNPYFAPVQAYLAGAGVELLTEMLDEAAEPAEVFAVHRLLYPLEAVTLTLPPTLRARFAALTARVRSRLERDQLDLYVCVDNPVEARRAAGKRLNARGAWATLNRQVLDMRYAAGAGFKGANLQTFYRRTVADLERLAFRPGYGSELVQVVLSLAESISLDARNAGASGPDSEAARRLAAYGARLFDWLVATWGLEHLDAALLGRFAAFVYKGLGQGYNRAPAFGRIIQRLLATQLPDGSWQTDPRPHEAAEGQADYLLNLYRTTGACLAGLRVLRTDALNPENGLLELS